MLRDIVVKVGPRGTTDKVPPVYTGIFPGACHRCFIFSIDTDDDRTKLLYPVGTPIADMDMDIVDTTAAEDFRSVGKTAALVTVSSNADGDLLGDIAIFKSAELSRRGTQARLRINFVRQDLVDGVRRS